MSPILVGIAIAVTAGAVIAISAREARVALVGLAIALGAAPFLGDPLPPASTLAMRVIGGALAAYLLRAALNAADEATDLGPARSRGGSGLGWPVEALLAVAAWIVAVHVSVRIGVLYPTGPSAPIDDPLALLTPGALIGAAGLASIVVGLVPALGGRGVVRTAIGLLVLLQGVLLFRTGMSGAPGDLEQLAGVAMLVAVAIAGSVLIALQTRPDPRPRTATAVNQSGPDAEAARK